VTAAREPGRRFARNPGDAEAFAALRRQYKTHEDFVALARLLEARASYLRFGARREPTGPSAAKRPDAAAEPGVSTLYLEAADARSKAGQPHESANDLVRAFHHDPRNHAVRDRAREALRALELWPHYVEVLELALHADGPLDRGRATRATLHLEVARVWEQQLGRLDRATAHYRAANQLDPSQTEALEALGRLYRALGDWALVADVLRQQVERTTDPLRRGQLNLEIGKVLGERLGRVTEAAARLEEAARLIPGDTEALEVLGDLAAGPHWPTRPTPPVEAAAAGASASLPPTAYAPGGGLERASAAYVLVAERCQRAGDDERAVRFLRRALGANPANTGATQALYALYERTERYGDLSNLFEQQAAWASTSEEARDVLLKRASLALDRLGDRELAKRCYEEILSLGRSETTFGSDHTAPGLATDDETYRTALSALEQLVRQDDDAPRLARLLERRLTRTAGDLQARVEALVELAELYLTKLERPNDAATLLDEALGLAPTHGRAVGLAAEQLRESGRRRELAVLLRRAVDAAGERGDVEAAVAWATELADLAEKRLGDLELARGAWRSIGQLQPGSEPAREAERRLAARAKRWESLVELLQQEAASAPGAPERAEALRRTAQIFRDQVDPRKAIELFEASLQVAPNDANALRALADLYEREGDATGLVRTYRLQLDNATSKVERIAVLRRLAQVSDERIDDHANAVESCREILRLLPGDRETTRRLESLMERSGDDEELLAVLITHAESGVPPAERAATWIRVGRLATRLNQLDRAIEALEQARRLAPEQREPIDQLVDLYDQVGRLADVARVLERALAQRTDTTNASPAARLQLLRRYARTVDSLGDTARAVEAWSSLAELSRTEEAADPEALVALARLHESRSEWAEAARVLEQLLALTPSGQAAIERALRLAEIFERRLQAPERAIATLNHVLAQVEPSHTETHARLRALYRQLGRPEEAIRVAERELLLTHDVGARVALCFEVALVCEEQLGDLRRATLAYERVVELDPNHLDARAALTDLLERAGDAERFVAVGLDLLERTDDPLGRKSLLLRLADASERALCDPRGAFELLRQAHAESPGDETLSAIEALAERSAQWAPLVQVYDEERARSSDSATRLSLALRAALVVEQKLNDPTSAFQRLAEVAQHEDPQGVQVLAELEAIAQRAGALEPVLGSGRRDPARDALRSQLLDVYALALEARPSLDGKLDAVGRRARCREAAGELSGAMDEWMSAFRLAPARNDVAEEIFRLAEVTARWNDALTVHSIRFGRATTFDEKLEIAREAARIAEERVGDPLKALRAHLHAFRLAPAAEETKAALWRLAAQITPPQLLPTTPTPVADRERSVALERERAGTAVEAEITPAEEITQPIRLEELEFVEADPATKAQRRRPPGEPPAPPPFNAWSELASAYEGLPVASPRERIDRLLTVAELWERGARDVPHAMVVLERAYLLAPDDLRPLDEAERMAHEHREWDRFLATCDRLVARSSSVAYAGTLHLRAAAVEERLERFANAEDRYRIVVGIDPSRTEARTRLEALYRSRQRHNELAVLLEQRVSGLLEMPPVGDERASCLRELAELAETKLDQPYEAITTWERLLQQEPKALDAYVALERLYGRVGRWAKVIDLLARKATLESEAAAIARHRRRIAEIYDRELQLPDRAAEAYQAVLELTPEDEASWEALERLLDALRRPLDRATLLQRRAARLPQGTRQAEQVELLTRAARAYEQAGEDPQAATTWRKLLDLRPADETIADALARALARTGRPREAAEAFVARIEAAERRGAPVTAVADLWTRLGELYAQDVGDEAAASKALERALELDSHHVEALGLLAALKKGAGELLSAARYRLREAELLEDEPRAVETLTEAANELFAAGERTAARDALERALDRASQRSLPALPTALAARATLAEEEGDLERAIVLRQREAEVVTSAAVRASVLCRIAQLERRRGNEAAAQTALEAALAADRHAPQVVVALVDNDLANGSPAIAAERIRAALDALDSGRGPSSNVHSVVAADGLGYGAPVNRDAHADGSIDPVWVDATLRIAEALERATRGSALEDSYRLLLEMETLARGELRLRVALGLNRFRARRFREASSHLSSTGDHPEAPQHPSLVADALYHAALAERMLKHTERVIPLLEGALAHCPSHLPSIMALAEAAFERGDVVRGAGLIRQQAESTTHPSERRRLFEEAARIYRTRVGDRSQARAALEAALAAADTEDKPAGLQQLVGAVLAEAYAADDTARVASLEERLATSAEAPADRVAHWLGAAQASAKLGDPSSATRQLEQALALDPLCEEALTRWANLRAAAKDHDAVLARLGPVLGKLPPLVAGADLDAPMNLRRAMLWELLAQAQSARGDTPAQLGSLERATAVAPHRAHLREALVAAYRGVPEQAARSIEHLHALLELDPTRAEWLSELGRTAGTVADGRLRETVQLVAELVRPSDAPQREGQARPPVAAPPLPGRTGNKPSDELYAGVLTEEDLRHRLAPTDALVLTRMFETLWEAAPVLFADGAYGLGLSADDRVSPVSNLEPAKIYSACARALASPPTTLYISSDPSQLEVTVACATPPAVVLGLRHADGSFSATELRFLIGRALELARPPFVLAAGLPAAEFSRLFGSVIRAFHPRHARRRVESGDTVGAAAARLRHALPYKISKQLADILADSAEVSFDSGRWRHAVLTAGIRAGLLCAGDLRVALRLVARELGIADITPLDEAIRSHELLRDLLRFALRRDSIDLRAKLWG
jgi:tetratricopeptide (TPR) repeat protein